MFRSNLMSLAFVSVVAVLLSGTAQASKVVSCNSKSNIDFGDAPSNYGTACHQTDTWQKLGTGWSAESANNTVDSDNPTDDGVTWRTKAVGTSAWSNWSSDEVLTQGDDVEFKFKVTRVGYGHHQYDEIKAWADWDQDSIWNNNNEVLIEEQWFKNQN
ncbi:MAG: hypothetical protein ACJAXJ_001898 [Colwellia sp.]|jgi:hypothetical protein